MRNDSEKLFRPMLMICRFYSWINYICNMEISIGDAIKQFLRESRAGRDIRALQIKDVWENLMGKTIANYTSNIQIVKRTLYISTDVAPLKNELTYQRDKIADRINEHFGEKVIDKVVIQ